MTTPKLAAAQRERLQDIDNGDQPTWDEAGIFLNAGLIAENDDDGDYHVTPVGRALLEEVKK